MFSSIFCYKLMKSAIALTAGYIIYFVHPLGEHQWRGNKEIHRGNAVE